MLRESQWCRWVERGARTYNGVVHDLGQVLEFLNIFRGM